MDGCVGVCVCVAEEQEGEFVRGRACVAGLLFAPLSLCICGWVGGAVCVCVQGGWGGGWMDDCS
jgi:hypothetical protein